MTNDTETVKYYHDGEKIISVLNNNQMFMVNKFDNYKLVFQSDLVGAKGFKSVAYGMNYSSITKTRIQLESGVEEYGVTELYRYETGLSNGVGISDINIKLGKCDSYTTCLIYKIESGNPEGLKLSISYINQNNIIVGYKEINSHGISNVYLPLIIDSQVLEEVNKIRIQISIQANMIVKVSQIYYDRTNTITYYEYDGNDNITKKSYGDSEITYTYDNENYLVGEDDNYSNTISYTYDSNKNLITKNTNQILLEEYSYTDDNDLESDYESIDGEYEYSNEYNYDSIGNVLSHYETNCNLVSYSYDSRYRLVNRSDTLRIKTNEYDTNNRINKVRLSHTSNQTYNDLRYMDDKLDIAVVGNNISTYKYSYDLLDRVSEVKLNNIPLINQTYLTEEYDKKKLEKISRSGQYYKILYDSLDRVDKIYYSETDNIVISDDSYKNRYMYDGLGRLITEFYKQNGITYRTDYSYKMDKLVYKEIKENNIIRERSYINKDIKLLIENDTGLLKYVDINKTLEQENKVITNNYIYKNYVGQFYDIFPLNGTIVSTKGLDGSVIGIDDKNTCFSYDSYLRRRVYKTSENKLVYELGNSSSGTFMFRIKVNTSNVRRCVFKTTDSYNEVGLYIEPNGEVVVMAFERVISTGHYISFNNWNFVGLSYSIDYDDDYDYLNLTPYVNGWGIEYNYYEYYVTNNMLTYIGVDDVNESSNLNGYIESFIHCLEYTTVNGMNNVYTGVDVISVDRRINAKGLVKQTLIANSIVTYDYNYLNHTPKIVSVDVGYGNNEDTFTYGYDSDNNITSITSTSFGNRYYQYDYRGYLVNDCGVGITYDDLGNITRYGSNTYTYNNGILSYVGSKQIVYINNSYYPSSYDGYNYKYEGNNLVEVTKDNKTIRYTYLNGLLKKKAVTIGSSTITTRYYYIDGELKREVNNNYQIDYLYDGNSLVGFIKNNSMKYYYVKDITGLILGYIDSSGSMVVRYSYNAFGLVTSSSSNDENKMRYKGYYYDEDIKMYYCKSRFYVPQWNRWLTPDSLEYLDVYSFDNRSLFIYCNNNPVMLMDPTGSIAISSLIIGSLIAGAIVGGAISGVSGAISGDRGWTLAGDIIGGAAVGTALGLATSLGGAFAAGAISGGAAIGAFAGTTALSFVAGGGQSALNQFTHTGKVDWGEAAIDGGLTSVQSMVSFGMGAAMRYCGMWDTLGSSEFTGSIKLGWAFSHTPTGILRGGAMYLERNALQLVGRTFVRNVFTIPYAILKYFI